MSKIFEYKTWPEYYDAVDDGSKPFEVRRDDRNETPEPGDIAHLRRWDPTTETYTGEETKRRITYVLRGGQFGIEPGYMVLGLCLLGEYHGR